MLSCLICHGDRFQCADLKSVEHESFHFKCIYLFFFLIEVKGPDSSAYIKYFSQCTYARQHRYIVATQWMTFVYIDISKYRLQFYSIFLISYFSFRIFGMELRLYYKKWEWYAIKRWKASMLKVYCNMCDMRVSYINGSQ